MKALPRLQSTTVVFPSEYDLDAQLRRTIKQSNITMDAFPKMDIGKIVGLYIAYKRLQEVHSNEAR